MPDDTDPTSERRVTDDPGTAREWADAVGAVPVRTERARGASEEVALVPADETEGDERERLDWSAFGDVLADSETVVVYDASGDADGLSVFDAEEVDVDEAQYEATAGPSFEERNVEGREYAEHEMRGAGASGATTDDDSADEAVRETRPDREASAAPGLDLNDVGKTVVDEEGTELGVVAQASGDDGAVHVDVDPGVTERILSTLGWTGVEDVDYSIPPERIRRVTDDRVVLYSGDIDTAEE